MRTDEDSKGDTEYKVSTKLFNKRKKSVSTEDTVLRTPEKRLKWKANCDKSYEASSGMESDTRDEDMYATIKETRDKSLNTSHCKGKFE